MDPAVVALLNNHDVEDLSLEELHVQIASIKLQQARIRGMSDYASHVMDQALERGMQDRKQYELLDERLLQIDATRQRRFGRDSSSRLAGADEPNLEQDEDSAPKSKDSTDDGKLQATEIDDDETDFKEEVLRLRKELHRAQDALTNRLEAELDALRLDQEAHAEQEQRLRRRWKSMQEACPPSMDIRLRQLHQAFDTAAPFKVDCSCCHELNAACMAVIPCGHLCLCVECSQSLLQHSDVGMRRCPLCRGQLLSVLKVFYNHSHSVGRDNASATLTMKPLPPSMIPKE